MTAHHNSTTPPTATPPAQPSPPESAVCTPLPLEPTSRGVHIAFSSLVGLASLAILLQGLWAGIFLEHDGERDNASSWIDVHARGADVALVLALAATILAVVKLRSRRDLILGSVLLTIGLGAEAFLGGLIRDDSKDTLTAVHVPLGMLLMAVAVWLPLRARLGRAHAPRPQQ